MSYFHLHDQLNRSFGFLTIDTIQILTLSSLGYLFPHVGCFILHQALWYILSWILYVKFLRAMKITSIGKAPMSTFQNPSLNTPLFCSSFEEHHQNSFLFHKIAHTNKGLSLCNLLSSSRVSQITIKVCKAWCPMV